jgi:hypothetical protein
MSGDTLAVGANGEASAEAIITNGSTASANITSAGSGAGITTYTYSSLSAGIRYGFRFCVWDGASGSAGVAIQESTAL